MLVVIQGTTWAGYVSGKLESAVEVPDEVFEDRDSKLLELETYRKDGLSADNSGTD